jgi:glutamyl-tRNA reductase
LLPGKKGLMRRLLLTGLNHSTAPLELRERLAFSEDRVAAATAEFRRRFVGSEVVFLSTCNRVEVYAAATQTMGAHGSERGAATDPSLDGGPDIATFLADFHGVPRGDFSSSLYTKRARDAAVHLFNVAASLDSMVLGETQILGQVRTAYDVSQQLGATGPMLNGLSQTPLVEGRCSAASVAVDFARGIFEHFQDKSVLCVGSGKMVRLVLRHFAALRPGRMTVLGRDVEKAKALALLHNGDGASIDLLADHLATADIIITSTGATHPIVTHELFRGLQRRRRFRPAFIIDLAVPRDVEASVGTLDNVHLYNIDDLQQVVGNTERLRGGAIDGARAILAQHLQEWAVWNRQRELGPAIRGLYDRYQQLAREELRRALVNGVASGSPSGAGGISDERIEALARRVANKLLHEPMRVLRSPALGHEGARYLHAMNELFGLGLTGGAGGDVPLDDAALTELTEIAREASQTDISSEPDASSEPEAEDQSEADGERRL